MLTPSSQKYLSLNSAVDTAAALALAWSSAIDACLTKVEALSLLNAPSSLVHVAAAVHGCGAPASGGRPLATKAVLVFTDVDIMCPANTSDDALKLAASFILGMTKAAEKGIGVVVTAMDQMQVRIVVCQASSETCHNFHR